MLNEQAGFPISAFRFQLPSVAALWRTADGLGDIDTNCAIVGGIVAARVGRAGLPADWIARRERLPGWAFGDSAPLV